MSYDITGDNLTMECDCGEKIEVTRYFEENGLSIPIDEGFRPCSSCGREFVLSPIDSNRRIQQAPETTLETPEEAVEEVANRAGIDKSTLDNLREIMGVALRAKIQDSIASMKDEAELVKDEEGRLCCSECDYWLPEGMEYLYPQHCEEKHDSEETWVESLAQDLDKDVEVLKKAIEESHISLHASETQSEN